MKITKEDMARVTKAIATVAQSKPVIPVLEMARIEAKEGTLSIMASDLQIWLSLECPCEGDLEPVLVPAHKLADCVDKLNADVLEVSMEADSLIIKAKRSTRKLATQSIASFPIMPTVNAEFVEIDPARFADGIGFVTPFICNEPHRDYMNGVHAKRSPEGGLVFVATNGRAMAQFEYGEIADWDAVTFTPSFTKAVCSMAGEGLTLASDSTRALASWQGGQIIAMLVNGTFPDTDRVIPAPAPNRATAQADDVLKASAGVQALADKQSTGSARALQVSIMGDGLEFYARSASGEATDVVTGESEGACVFGVSSAYFDPAIRGFAGSIVTIAASDPILPVRIDSTEKADRFAIVMPRRI